MSTNYEDDITYFNKLVGNTPFSFFKSVNTPVIVFDYYEKYTKELLNKICIQTNQKIDCEVEYLYNSEIDAFCFSQGVVNKIVFLEGTVLSIYRFASILSCVYRTILMKEEPKYQTIHKFDIRSVKDEEKMSSLIYISDSIETNIITDYIAMIAMKIIIAHEIGHLLSGHIEYRKRHGETAISFAMGNTMSQINNTTLQVMEIDANEFSACHIMSVLESELINDQKINKIVFDKNQIYRLVGCALQCVFYLVGIKNNYWKTEEPQNYTHPPASTRVSLFLDVIRKQFGKERDKDWIEIVKGVIIAQKNIFAYYETDYDDAIQFVFDIMGIDEYGKVLIEEWRVLKKEFASYSNLPFI